MNASTKFGALLVLTDGNANEGVTETRDIIKNVVNLTKDNNSSIYTLGYGNDHNEDLLG